MRRESLLQSQGLTAGACNPHREGLRKGVVSRRMPTAREDSIAYGGSPLTGSCERTNKGVVEGGLRASFVRSH